ncbi:flavin reductase family protein [Chelativorans xinjiangense]|uniref:flavin reductase family protein n=1 Tax=Chelativorans xinjiangense TaxID=2681485 RepID=UPI0013576B1F|nr:iron-sulfur cluster-binding domain-containing protein [Chelativorans xinjiangense]
MSDVLEIPENASARARCGWLRLRCTGVRVETPSIRTFAFRSEDGTVRHEPGQAITLALDLDGERHFRTFSISSAVGEGEGIELTVKAHPQGRVTPWMHRAFTPGFAVEASPPHGRFTLGLRRGGPLAFISAGSGATPLVSMLRRLAGTEPEADVAWLHFARTPAEMLFSGALARLQGRMGRLSVGFVASRPEPGWFGYRGRIGRRLLSVAIPDLARREVFCCGPGDFMREARLIHRAEGGDPDAFYTESFGAELEEQHREDVSSPADAAAFRLKVGGQTIGIGAGETILQACRRQGIALPFGCREGLCGTCLVRKKGGTVLMHDRGGVTEGQKEGGFVLACVTRVASDTEIEI